MAAALDPENANRLRIALGRIARTVDRQVTGDGMTRSQLTVLGTVARHKAIGIGELAELEGVNPTMLSRVIAKLEADGLLRRAQGANDRRAVDVVITAPGSRLHARLRRQRTELFAERLAQLPEPQLATLVAAIPALETLGEALRRPAGRVGHGGHGGRAVLEASR